MKMRIPTYVVALTAVALLAAACSSSREARPVVLVGVPENQVVLEAPPTPRAEVPGAAPGEAYTWISGYWSHMDSRWVWLPGHWERTRPGAVWVAGRWDQTDKGWAWIPGRWEPTTTPPTVPPSAVGGAEEP